MKIVMDGIMEHMVLLLMRMLADGGGAQHIVTHPVTHSFTYMDILLLRLIGNQLISDNAVTTLLGPEQKSTGKINMDSITLIYKHLQQYSYYGKFWL